MAIAPAPREAIASIAFAAPPNTAHGIANHRIGALLSAWMREHGNAITGIDPQKAMLLQVDKRRHRIAAWRCRAPRKSMKKRGAKK